MENEIKSNETVSPNDRKSKDIIITRRQLKKIVFVIYLFLICIFCIYLLNTYFNSVLTHSKAKELFIENWNKMRTKKLVDVKILGIKKIKTDTYWVKFSYSYMNPEYETAEGKIDYTQYLVFSSDYEEDAIVKEKGLRIKGFFLHKYNYIDFIFTKWDTGWFIEEKKK